MKRPRWLDPVVASDGRRLTLGNWLLTVVLPTLLVTPPMVLLGVWLFQEFWVPWLDRLDDKYITKVFLPYVMPSIFTAVFCTLCCIRTSKFNLHSATYMAGLSILGHSTWLTLYILFSQTENIAPPKWLPNIWLIWAMLLFGPTTIGLLAALGLRKFTMFFASTTLYVVMPLASIFYSAFFPLVFFILSSTPGLAIENYWATSLSLAAIYIGTGLAAGLAVWLTLRRSPRPDADASPQQPPSDQTVSDKAGTDVVANRHRQLGLR